MQELLNLKKFKKGLIVHHWDTDGLCSAALLKNFLEKTNEGVKIDVRTPTINNYYLKEEDYKIIEENNYDFILTCDINFPEHVVNRLTAICPTHVYVFDHHKQKPYKSVFYYNKDYPSCSLVINEYLGQPMNLIAIMGAIGDKEEKIKKDAYYWPIIQKILHESGLSLPEALHMRSLIDSCYQTNDYYSFLEIIDLLQHDPLTVLQDANLRNNLVKINKAISNIINLEPMEKLDNIFIFFVNSKYNILSQCTRILSRKYSNNFIVVYQKHKSQTNVYVRRGDLGKDLGPIINWARAEGYNSGGKREVAGIIYNGEFKDIKNELIGEIKKL